MSILLPQNYSLKKEASVAKIMKIMITYMFSVDYFL